MSGANAENWNKQASALRDPRDIWSCSTADAGIVGTSLAFRLKGEFAAILERLAITIFVSREYENLLISLYGENGKLRQRFLPLPHPSGIACDRKAGALYVASTRNPNNICQFKPSAIYDEGREGANVLSDKPLLLRRRKYYPGLFYFHDLAIIGDKLYANAVGMNGVVEIDFSHDAIEKLSWYPKCVEATNGSPLTRANYIQLNSIAGGATLDDSFFSASGCKIGRRRPGHLNYPVDKQGVIFSGSTREPIAYGLTRPHSARLQGDKVWVANSGYGEFGYITEGRFEAITRLKGWSRGVCLVGEIAFVGASRVIPRFRHYAPGLVSVKDRCGVFAISMRTGSVLGSIEWPAGNQIFAIDYLPRASTSGFVHRALNEPVRRHILIAFNHQ